MIIYCSFHLPFGYVAGGFARTPFKPLFPDMVEVGFCQVEVSGLILMGLNYYSDH